MDLRDIRTFLAVADARSFLKAADQLFISRQAISKTIRNLENELEVELFVRNQRGAMLTPAGIFLYSKASTLVAEFDKLKTDTMNVNRSYRPIIRVSMTQGVYSHFADALFGYGERYRNELELRINSCLETETGTLLADRKAEAVLSFTRPAGSIGVVTELLTSRIVFLIHKDNPLLKETPKPKFSDLAALPMLLYTAGTDRPVWWYDFPRKQDLPCSDLQYLFALLEQDRGIVPIPEISVPSYLDFAVAVKAPKNVMPVSVFCTTLQKDHYSLVTYTQLEALQRDLFSQDR